MKKITRGLVVGLLALAGLLAGCTNDTTTPPPPSGIDVTGDWTLTVAGTTYAMHLDQNGDALTGTVQGVPLTGSVNGDTISISSGFPGGPLLTAEGTVSGNTMAGAYTATEPGGAPQTGAWSATLP